jgi:hypothetical protein
MEEIIPSVQNMAETCNKLALFILCQLSPKVLNPSEMYAVLCVNL